MRNFLCNTVFVFCGVVAVALMIPLLLVSGFAAPTCVVLVVLKCLDKIQIDWIWVFSPLWIVAIGWIIALFCSISAAVGKMVSK